MFLKAFQDVVWAIFYPDFDSYVIILRRYLEGASLFTQVYCF